MLFTDVHSMGKHLAIPIVASIAISLPDLQSATPTLRRCVIPIPPRLDPFKYFFLAQSLCRLLRPARLVDADRVNPDRPVPILPALRGDVRQRPGQAAMHLESLAVAYDWNGIVGGAWFVRQRVENHVLIFEGHNVEVPVKSVGVTGGP
jgi:hypothetical protein